MNTTWIRSKHIQTPQGKKSGIIWIEDSKIIDITPYTNTPLSIPGIDATEDLVLPGFIDLHIHGAGGWYANTETTDILYGMANFLPSVGVTAFQPSVGNAPHNQLLRQLKTIGVAIDNQKTGARMLSIHLEGPFISPLKKGSFQNNTLQTPSIKRINTFIHASSDHIKQVSLAPELEGNLEIIKYLVSKNIIVAGAHTNATFEQAMKGIQAGLSLSTHTGNAQRSIHHREIGALGAFLLSEITCEIICDFVHLSPEMIQLILKLKRSDQLAMVSDSILAAGVESGQYLYQGRHMNIGKNSKSTLLDGTIAGSTGNLLLGFKNCVQNLEMPYQEAIKLTSLTPARLAGVDQHKGSLAIGKDADILILDSSLNLKTTICEGKLAFNKELFPPSINPAFQKYRIK